jgi:NitT/TauT family transport system substrate-binding protein
VRAFTKLPGRRRRLSRRRAIRLLGVTLPVLLAACRSSRPPDGSQSRATAAAAVQRVSLKSAYTTTGASQAPVWAAKEGGFFAQESIDLSELTLLTNLTALLGAIQAQQTPLGFLSAQPVVPADLQGADFIIVAGFGSKVVGEIWSVPAIQTPAQLKGKAIGVTALGSAGETGAAAALAKIGIPHDQVGWVATGPPAQTLAALTSGRIQAAPLTPPDDIAAKSAGMHMLLDVATLDIPTQGSCIVTTRKYAAAHPDVVERFVRAVIEGTHRLEADEQFAAKVIQQYSGLTDPAAISGAIDYYKQLWTKDGFPSVPGMQATLDALVATVPEAKSAKPDQFMDLTYVQKIKASGLLDQLYGKGS